MKRRDEILEYGMNLSRSSDRPTLLRTVPAPQLSRLQKIYSEDQEKLRLEKQAIHLLAWRCQLVVWITAEAYSFADLTALHFSMDSDFRGVQP